MLASELAVDCVFHGLRSGGSVPRAAFCDPALCNGMVLRFDKVRVQELHLPDYNSRKFESIETSLCPRISLFQDSQQSWLLGSGAWKGIVPRVGAFVKNTQVPAQDIEFCLNRYIVIQGRFR